MNKIEIAEYYNSLNYNDKSKIECCCAAELTTASAAGQLRKLWQRQYLALLLKPNPIAQLTSASLLHG